MRSKLLTAILTVGVFALPLFAQTGIPAGPMSQCDAQMQTFLTTYQIPGATLAIAKNGRLVYMRAFGTANQAGTEATQPYHMFRIASISKPITSIAIMKLIENGQLSLSDKPFGPGGILNVDPYFANANITDARVYDITIQHLLEHAAGWNRDVPISPNPLPPYPWSYTGSDPIDFPLHVTQTLGEPNPVSRRALIKFNIQRGLNFTPGTSQNYSNIGYLVLGEVIEKKTGLTYENYVKQTIFAPLGIYDIRLGKNLLADKQEREGEYNSPFTTLSSYGTGQFVLWQYGGNSVEAMDAHGGWISTARDLVRLLTAVDGFPSRPDILSPATIQNMTAPSATNPGYAKGWSINPAGTWWHGGSLPGTYSWMVRTSTQFSSQLTWAVIMNKRQNDSGFANAVSNLGFGSCVNSTTAFPTHDLFDVPAQNSSAMNFSSITSNSMNVNWTSGDGNGRVLIMRSGGVPNKFPLDGTEYEAGADLGDGNYLVYSGAGNTTTVGNLNSNTNYQFRLYEYRKNVNTGNYALYQLGNPASGSQNTLGTTAQTRPRFDFDGDGKSDISIYRPSVGQWWYSRSSDGGNRAAQFGNSADKIVPGDFTGDGKTDIAIFRPTTGEWFILRSEDGSFYSFAFGTSGDIPAPADFDGDGKDDVAVFRPSTSTWYVAKSTGGFIIQHFGQAGDVPVVADYDGDNKADIAIYRVSSGQWWIQRTTAGLIAFQFGNSTDKPVQGGDYTGDGKGDVALFRPGTGEWFVLRSENQTYYSFPFGTNGDVPAPGDFDGDGKIDVTVFRPSTNIWYSARTTAGTLIQSFGQTGDSPVPNAFVP